LDLQSARRHATRARLARLRWTIELDYRQLSGELGLDHHEGRSYYTSGFTTTALGDLRARLHTLKPMCPNSAAAGLKLL
jgi:hypothetical protein